MKIIPVLVLVAGLVVGCSAPVPYTKAPMQRLNDHTRWVDEGTPTGFLLTVEFTQYQAIPVPSEVARAGRSELLALADRVAREKGRKVQPIPDSAIRESSGRNGLTGISSWSGQARVEYAP